MHISPLFVIGSKPSICRRISIAWDDDEADEDCDVLVLSSRPFRTSEDVNELSRTLYLDLRINKATHRLDWAFAGLKLQKGLAEYEWLHFIDSRIGRLSPGDPDKSALWNSLHRFGVDEGRVVVANDAHGIPTEYEYGKGWNPRTGKENSEYCEVWKDEVILDSQSLAYLVLTLGDHTTDIPSITGFIAIIGNHALALAQNSSEMELVAVRAESDGNKRWDVTFLSERSDALKEELQGALDLLGDNGLHENGSRRKEVTLVDGGRAWAVFDAGIKQVELDKLNSSA